MVLNGRNRVVARAYCKIFRIKQVTRPALTTPMSDGLFC